MSHRRRSSESFQRKNSFEPHDDSWNPILRFRRYPIRQEWRLFSDFLCAQTEPNRQHHAGLQALLCQKGRQFLLRPTFSEECGAEYDDPVTRRAEPLSYRSCQASTYFEAPVIEPYSEASFAEGPRDG